MIHVIVLEADASASLSQGKRFMLICDLICCIKTNLGCNISQSLSCSLLPCPSFHQWHVEFPGEACQVSSDDHNPKNVTTAPASMVMRFGSGDISTKIASDEVQIGSLKVYMENGLLLMVPRMKEANGCRCVVNNKAFRARSHRWDLTLTD